VERGEAGGRWPELRSRVIFRSSEAHYPEEIGPAGGNAHDPGLPGHRLSRARGRAGPGRAVGGARRGGGRNHAQRPPGRGWWRSSLSGGVRIFSCAWWTTGQGWRRPAAAPATPSSPPSPAGASALALLSSARPRRSWAAPFGSLQAGERDEGGSVLPLSPSGPTPPLGDLPGTLLPLLATSPVDFRLAFGDDRTRWIPDTRELNKALGDVPRSYPEVLSFLERCARR
jgi:hypothetical protein